MDRPARRRAERQPEPRLVTRAAFPAQISVRPANDNPMPLGRRVAVLAPWLLAAALAAVAIWYLLGPRG